MSKEANRSRVDHIEVRRLVGVIDEEGTRLSRTEIEFIANIIDTKQKKFNDKESRRVHRIYDKRVVNGLPDYD